MKFDFVLMNPPYSSHKIGDEFYKKFIFRCHEVADTVIVVHPSSIFDSHTSNKKEKALYNTNATEVEYIDPKLFDAGIRGNIIISKIGTGGHNITVIKDGKTKMYGNISEIRFEESPYLEEFENKLRAYLEKHPDTIGNHLHFGPNYTGFTRRDLILTDLPKDNLYVFIYKPNASYDTMRLLYDTVHRDKKPIGYDEKQLYKTTTAFVMFGKDEAIEAENFIKYTKTSFLKLCNIVSRYIVGNKIKYLAYPWMDFTQEWDDEKLFAEIGMQYNVTEVDKTIKEY